jgi:hypothetical protein
MNAWSDRLFRASPALELRQLADFPPEQRAPFLELEDDPEFYGLLIPRPPARLGIKSVTTQTAMLFRELATPAPIRDIEQWRDDVIDLVLDSVLEIEADDAFVSGADAFPLFYPALPPLAGAGVISQLSREALEHAEDLATGDLNALTSALYLYNRMPLTKFWTARFPDAAAILAHLGNASDAILDRWWSRTTSSGWISWQSRVPSLRQGDGTTYKLYLSPRPEHIRDAFHALVRVLAELPDSSMKIGHDAMGLLRPDKLVSYFATREELDRAGDALRRELAGCPAHGVPFTAPIDDDGLLSWGVDPPDSERALSWLERKSWRLWIAMRLAAALAIAKGSPSPQVERWRFAVERVRRHGVDVDTWTPVATLWSADA